SRTRGHPALAPYCLTNCKRTPSTASATPRISTSARLTKRPRNNQPKTSPATTASKSTAPTSSPPCRLYSDYGRAPPSLAVAGGERAPHLIAPRLPGLVVLATGSRLAGELHLAGEHLLDEHVDHPGIELCPFVPDQLLHRLVHGQPRAVDAVRRHRVEGVGHRQDAGRERDLLPFEAVRISPAVVALVMVADHLRVAAQHAHRLDHPRTDGGVGLDQPEFGVRQLAPFVEHCVADADLSDVVQDSSVLQPLDLA